MTAKLKPAMPPGGILAQHVDQDFADFVAGRTVTQRVCIGVWQAGGVSSSNQEKGRVNHTAYEALHFVEVTDPHEADKVRHLITQTRAARGLAVHQPALFEAPEDEQREGLLELLREWSSEQDVAREDLDARWLDYFGGPEHAASATVQAGSALQLREFALYVGAISDEPVGPAVDDDDTDPDDEDEPAVAGPAFSG